MSILKLPNEVAERIAKCEPIDFLEQRLLDYATAPTLTDWQQFDYKHIVDIFNENGSNL